MTDYLNPDKIYPDDISRRIDTPPGFDSVREGKAKAAWNRSMSGEVVSKTEKTTQEDQE